LTPRSHHFDRTVIFKRLCLRLPQELALWTIMTVLLILLWGAFMNLAYLILDL
jgi:hypothetical protein